MTSARPEEPGLADAARARAATELAHIDWQSAITSRDAGLLPCSSGENRILRLAASIPAGIPVTLNDTLSGLDRASISLAVRAGHHANEQRPADHASS